MLASGTFRILMTSAQDMPRRSDPWRDTQKAVPVRVATRDIRVRWYNLRVLHLPYPKQMRRPKHKESQISSAFLKRGLVRNGNWFLHVVALQPPLARPAMNHAIAVLHGAGGEFGLVLEARVDRGEVGPGRVHQLLEAVDHEVGLLVGVDLVFGAHDALEVEADAVG